MSKLFRSAENLSSSKNAAFQSLLAGPAWTISFGNIIGQEIHFFIRSLKLYVFIRRHRSASMGGQSFSWERNASAKNSSTLATHALHKHSKKTKTKDSSQNNFCSHIGCPIEITLILKYIPQTQFNTTWLPVQLCSSLLYVISKWFKNNYVPTVSVSL